MARAVGLIAFPAVIYVAIFYVHLSILNLSGPGDGFYSSAFQTSLKNNYLYNASTPKGIRLLFKSIKVPLNLERCSFSRGCIWRSSELKECHYERRLSAFSLSFVSGGQYRPIPTTDHNVHAQRSQQPLAHQAIQ